MDEFTRGKLIRLRALLATLAEDRTARIKAKQFDAHLTQSERDEYRRDLVINRRACDQGESYALSRDAQNYWDAFRDLCKRVNIVQGRAARNALVDEAADLMQQYEELSAADKGRFRELDPRGGDTKWSAALHELEHANLPFLDESATEADPLTNVENHTQRQFLERLIDRLDPLPLEVITPEKLEQQRIRGRAVLAVAKRLRR